MVVPGRNEVFFAVKEDFKGNAGNGMMIRTNSQSSACGFDFEVGKDYVVFAGENNGLWWTSHCSLTHELKEDDETLAWLRGISTAPQGAAIFGHVTMRVLNDDTWSLSPISGVPVILSGPESRTVTTDEQGNYRASGLQPGTYEVSAKAPAGYAAFETAKRDVVNRGCSEINMVTQIDGRIRGRVLLASGAPAAEVSVTLDEAGGEPDMLWFHQPDYTTTKADGSFEFGRLTPGAYVLGVNPTFQGSGGYYRKAVYPGTIKVGTSQVIDDLKFELPEDSPAPSIPLRVQFVDRDGKALEGTVMVDDEMWENPIGINPPVTDSAGVALLMLREGTRYQISAYANVGETRQVCAEPVEVVAKGELKPLTLVATHPYGNCRRPRK